MEVDGIFGELDFKRLSGDDQVLKILASQP